MRIEIANRLRPFSHTPGVLFVLPGSTLSFQCYPALIRVYDLSKHKPQLKEEIPLNIKGPVQNYTVLQDLTNGSLRIWGHAINGYFRFRIHALKDSKNAFKLVLEKGDLHLPDSQGTCFEMPSIERLSLGSHKAQNWDDMKFRESLSEIFPIWFQLGQLTPYNVPYESKNDLLSKCVQEGSLQSFKDLWRAGFDHALAPRAEDSEYQGFDLPPLEESKLSPLILLTQGSRLIRNMFLQQTKNQIFVLPILHPEFHCGRLININCDNLGFLDFEWTKKSIRRAKFCSRINGEVHFIWQKHIKTFRLISGKEEQCVENPLSLQVKEGEIYTFDRFEK